MSTSNSSRLESGAQISNTDRVLVLGQSKVEVPSQSSDSTYTVEFGSDGEATCTCMDHQMRGTTCKHIFAACDRLGIFNLEQ